MSWLSALSHGLVAVERWASRLLVLAFVTLIVANVTMRYVAGRPLVYAEELAAILLVWLVFVATSITVHDRAQIGVTMLVEKLPFEVRGAVDLAVLGLVSTVLGMLLWFSVQWVLSPAVAFEQIITTGWGKVPFFWIVPVFSGCALIHVLADLAEAIVRHRPIEIAQDKGLEP
ncbi:MAG: TRAP transporter small permease subunit [Paracoccus sp. (in: a-proteobacteria)]|uniref:TRAP transporter small permease n=1 Tax=Paracoccus sp. TaxID=267 RepID=UPI0026DF1044|nr:TRAP transporter small permease subunit [Paracoccus sp. (in: a-proteobacteria)]MDO5620966.1 TRAP transporter small permease subunit [Paracoccus sp. (in: a-proteobacteria)]